VLCTSVWSLLRSVNLGVVQPVRVDEWKLKCSRACAPAWTFSFSALQLRQWAMHTDERHSKPREHGQTVIEPPVFAEDVINNDVVSSEHIAGSRPVEPEHQTLTQGCAFTIGTPIAECVTELQVEIVDAHPDPDIRERSLQSCGDGRLSRTGRAIEEDHCARLRVRTHFGQQVVNGARRRSRPLVAIVVVHRFSHAASVRASQCPPGYRSAYATKSQLGGRRRWFSPRRMMVVMADRIVGASGPVLRSVDAVVMSVPDLAAGIDFYCGRLGHQLSWRNDAIGQAGLLCAESTTEIVCRPS
jgi:hypothetical protein